jgi:hypothetical protein
MQNHANNLPGQVPVVDNKPVEEDGIGLLVSFLNSLTGHHAESLVTTARRTEIDDFRNQPERGIHYSGLRSLK